MAEFVQYSHTDLEIREQLDSLKKLRNHLLSIMGMIDQQPELLMKDLAQAQMIIQQCEKKIGK